MPSMTRQQLIEQIKRKRSFLCVGLDSEVAKLPQCVKDASASDPEAVVRFNIAIIEATAPHCIAYKPNLAFYEVLGASGWMALEKTVQYIHKYHPHHLVIADAKRGDIGNTARMYAKAILTDLGADAVTVAPYMGSDSVTPFLEVPDKWTILLALTSNPNSADFQLTPDKMGFPLYERVIAQARTWGTPDQLMFVVGATQGERFVDIRATAPDSFLLVPGVGKQGGSLDEVAKYGMIPDCGLIVNSSRSIIFASSAPDFAEKAAEGAKALASQMDSLLQKYSKI